MLNSNFIAARKLAKSGSLLKNCYKRVKFPKFVILELIQYAIPQIYLNLKKKKENMINLKILWKN